MKLKILCHNKIKDTDIVNKNSRKVGLDCIDIDECISGLNSCHEFANCINNPGSYRCSCDNGYEGDGHLCEFILQCDPSIGWI